MSFNKYYNKKIYFLGIGGISMYAIAFLMKNNGAEVFGYDRSESETTKHLSEKGIPIFYNPSPENSKGADFCVCTAAINAENEEYQNVLNNQIPIIYRGEFLGEIIEYFNNSVGVSGTHGKSTTSGILSEIFLADKTKNPTILMGAILPSINSAYKIGKNDDLIFEACEYKDSFLSFKPKTSIILNVSLDHTDYFQNIDVMKESFIRFASESETVIANMDCQNALECALRSGKKVVTYSIENENATYYARNIRVSGEKTSFELYSDNKKIYSFELFVPGKHNLSNSIAAISHALESGISPETINNGLNNFKGIKRRFEYLGKVNGANIYDDYAHHPDEVIATLNAAVTLDSKKITCLFQPHTYTRLKDFFNNFSSIFNNANEKYNIKTIFLPTYAAREQNILGYDTEKLSLAVKDSLYIPSLKEASEYIMENASQDEMYILMGAGDVTNISKTLKFDN